MKGMHGEFHGESGWLGHPDDSSQVTRIIKVATTDLTVKAGETAEFEVANMGKLDHESVLGEAAGHEDGAFQRRQRRARKDCFADLDVHQSRHAFKYGCHLPGHFAAWVTAGQVAR